MSLPTTHTVSRGGQTVPLRGQPARVHHGRPVTVGPAVCEACRQLVWWSGALWSNQDGTWHRCMIGETHTATGDLL